jgi:hypothetical protein
MAIKTQNSDAMALFLAKGGKVTVAAPSSQQAMPLRKMRALAEAAADAGGEYAVGSRQWTHEMGLQQEAVIAARGLPGESYNTEYRAPAYEYGSNEDL